MSEETAALYDEREELCERVRELENNNKHLIELNAFLRQRPDLSVDRIPAYGVMRKRIDDLEDYKQKSGRIISVSDSHVCKLKADIDELETELHWLRNTTLPAVRLSREKNKTKVTELKMSVERIIAFALDNGLDVTDVTEVSDE